MLKKPLFIALTGGIACGKSSIAAIFKDLGAKLIHADEISKTLTHPGKPATQAIADYFGADILDESGCLKRKVLRKIIFNDPIARAFLETLLHPLIREAIAQQCAETTEAYCLIEIPLLPSKSLYPYLDKILVVHLDSKEEQIQRLMARDQISQNEALSILATQPTKEDYLAIADDVLINSGSLEAAKEKVQILHQKFVFK